MPVVIAYVVAPQRDAAEAIARDLLAHRLIACANMIEGMTSLYWWEGEIRQDSEVALILKTTEEQLPEVVTRICKIHPYHCPCVVTWRITRGNSNYLQWVETETATRRHTLAQPTGHDLSPVDCD